MKKRYLVKQYGLPAIILLFLLIWLSQQHAADNDVRYAALVNQKATMYDSPRWLEKPSQFLEPDRNSSRPTLLETKEFPSHNFENHDLSQKSLRNNTSVSSHIPLDNGVHEKKSAQDRYNHSNDEISVQKERSGNYSVGVPNKDERRQPSTDDGEMEQNGQLEIKLDVAKLSDKISDDVVKQEFRPSADANSVIDKTFTRLPENTIFGRPQMQTLKLLISNESAVSSNTESRNFSGTYDQSLNSNLIHPTVKPLTVQQRVPSNNDADDSLVLARQLALKNFVKTDEKHSPTNQQDDNRVMSKVSDILSVKSNQQDQHRHVFEKAVTNSSAGIGRRREIDEMRKFAEVPALPVYDLPLLKDSTSGDRVVSTTTRPDAVHEQISGLRNLVSNETLQGDSGRKLDIDEALADTDDVMSSAVVLGEVNPNKTYAVFSTTTENREALNFIFLLPLTALAWKRVGFDSIVIIVGPVDVWNSDELFHFVLSSVRQLSAVIVFLEPRPEKSVMISQVSRIFIANVLRARAAVANRRRPDVIDDTYLVTSDADIWPIYGDIYRLPPGRDVLSLNSQCCGAFSHRNVAYRMLPMANVGMRIGTWRRLTRRFGESPRSVDDILTAVVREFGPVALRPVHKGENVGWFLDQMMVSLLVAEWTKRHGAERVKLIPRDVGIDRLDRNAWGPSDSGGVADKIDAHLLGNAYLPGVWAQIIPLVRLLYGYGTNRYNWCIEYYDSFQKLFVAKYRSQGGVDR